MYEIEPLLSNIYLRNKDSWEQARMVAYIIAQTNSTQKLEVSDITKFSWDEDKKDVDTTISEADIARLTEVGQKLINKI